MMIEERATETVRLCRAAGQVHRAGEFYRRGLTPADVVAELQAAPPTAKQPTAAEIAVQKAREGGRAEAEAVVRACAEAGHVEAASEFIAAGMTGEQARKELVARGWRRTMSQLGIATKK